MQNIEYSRGILSADAVAGGSSYYPSVIVLTSVAVADAVAVPVKTSDASSNTSR